MEKLNIGTDMDLPRLLESSLLIQAGSGGIPAVVFNPQTFMKNLGKCELEIYEVLLARPGEVFDKDGLARMTPSRYSPTSSGFQNSLSRLNSLELISRSNGQVKLNPELIDLL